MAIAAEDPHRDEVDATALQGFWCSLASTIAAKSVQEKPLGATFGQRCRLKIANVVSEGAGYVWGQVAKIKDGASCRELQVGSNGVSALEVKAPNVEEGRVILYFHGGAYALWSTNTHRELLGRLSVATRACVIAANYRLAPQNPFPAAVEDALAVWNWVNEQYSGAQVAVGGDSSGGNLTFALLLQLSQLGLRQPVAAFAFAPWLLLHPGLVEERRQKSENAGRTIVAMWNRGAAALAHLYTHSHPADDPLVSPVLASVEAVSKFPPVMIQAVVDEPLADDAKDMASLCERAGVPVELNMRSAQTSLQDVDAFLMKHWANIGIA